MNFVINPKHQIKFKNMRTTNIFHRFHFYCLTIVTKPNLEEFLRKLFEKFALKIVANNIKYVWQLTGFFF